MQQLVCVPCARAVPAARQNHGARGHCCVHLGARQLLLLLAEVDDPQDPVPHPRHRRRMPCVREGARLKFRKWPAGVINSAFIVIILGPVCVIKAD